MNADGTAKWSNRRSSSSTVSFVGRSRGENLTFDQHISKVCVGGVKETHIIRTDGIGNATSSDTETFREINFEDPPVS